MRTTSQMCRLVLGLIIAFGFAPTAKSADITIPAGVDYLYTQAGSYFDFPAPIGPQPLFGNGIYAGGSDTVVQRLSDADATTGAAISTQITGLSLVGPPGSGIKVGLDPANLANDTGTMSFLVTSPVVAGKEIFGTISDTLNVYFVASTPGGVIIDHELFTSYGFWEAYLPAGKNEVMDFKIIIDYHITSGGEHIVSSFVPEPSTWAMLAAVGVIVPGYVGWRRRRS